MFWYWREVRRKKSSGGSKNILVTFHKQERSSVTGNLGTSFRGQWVQENSASCFAENIGGRIGAWEVDPSNIAMNVTPISRVSCIPPMSLPQETKTPTKAQKSWLVTTNQRIPRGEQLQLRIIPMVTEDKISLRLIPEFLPVTLSTSIKSILPIFSLHFAFLFCLSPPLRRH